VVPPQRSEGRDPGKQLLASEHHHRRQPHDLQLVRRHSLNQGGVVSHVWIAMDDEPYEPTTIHAVCRTAEGAKAAIEEHVTGREAVHNQYWSRLGPVTFKWESTHSDEWRVMGRYSFYKVERHEVVEA
jgi:hypothetical protein